MLLTLCKSCQYCLESMYWKCCEERFCFDKEIAAYRFDDADQSYRNGITNVGASLDSVVTEQPANNNHLPQHAIVNGALTREINELPVNANKIFEVFSKSMIFCDDPDLKSKASSESLEKWETTSEPDYLSDKPNRTKVYFEDEVNSPVTDFEIMFNDELSPRFDIFKIDEEEESYRKPLDPDVMSVEVKKQDVIKPSSITIKDETKITTQTPIYEYDSSKSVANLPSMLSLPRVESVKGILRQNRDLPRSFSAKTLEREDSSSKLNRLPITRVESLKNMDTLQMNKVLSRVPHRSASFLNIPEHLLPDTKPPLRKSDSLFIVSLRREGAEFSQISHLPDTPLIKTGNLPKFFTDSPSIPEYKGVTSLQSIKLQTDVKNTENDYSMPRYYGKVPITIEIPAVHESKSMPDLRLPSPNNKVSKRLVKIRSRLKPLVIKKGTNEKL